MERTPDSEAAPALVTLPNGRVVERTALDWLHGLLESGHTFSVGEDGRLAIAPDDLDERDAHCVFDLYAADLVALVASAAGAAVS